MPRTSTAKTSGNPFFVSEVLAAGTADVPSTVRDAVLARMARLSPPGQRLLEAIAIAPAHAELWLLERIATAELDQLEECLASGMVTAGAAAVSFRHELARLDDRGDINRPTVASPSTARRCKRWSTRPTSHPTSRAWPITPRRRRTERPCCEFAPAAAARAGSLGAHREAAAQYARALRFADGTPAERAGRVARTPCPRVLPERPARAGGRGATGGGRAAPRPQRSCAARATRCARSRACSDSPVDTQAAARPSGRRSTLLEQLEPGRELALAYGKVAQRRCNWEDLDGAIEWGTRSLELADNASTTPRCRSTRSRRSGRPEFRPDRPDATRASSSRRLELAIASA